MPISTTVMDELRTEVLQSVHRSDSNWRHPSLRRLFFLFLVLVWVAVVAAGMRVLLDYANRPAYKGNASKVWPKASLIPRTSGLPTLVVFAHPRCPCTRATIVELDRIMTRLSGRITADVVFVQPADTSEDWARTDLWRSASSIPGVKVMSDPGDVEVKRFNAQVSGQTLLYDRDGRMLFSGGITQSRGHEGDNFGSEAIVAFVTTGRAEQESSPVFGCYLRSTQQSALSIQPAQHFGAVSIGIFPARLQKTKEVGSRKSEGKPKTENQELTGGTDFKV
jgi:hypothetical protein